MSWVIFGCVVTRAVGAVEFAFYAAWEWRKGLRGRKRAIINALAIIGFVLPILFFVIMAFYGLQALNH